MSGYEFEDRQANQQCIIANRCITFGRIRFECTNHSIQQVVAILCLLVTLLLASTASAQQLEPDNVAQRYLELLLNRPRPGTALQRLYSHHVQQGTLEKLIAELHSKATLADERAGSRWLLLGLLRTQQSDPLSAVEHFKQAENALPDDPMAAFFHAVALIRLGRWEPATQALRRAIDRDPDRIDAMKIYAELARLYERIRQPNEVLRVWEQFEQKFPDDERVSEKVAAALVEAGQHEAALERYQRLAEGSKVDSTSKRIAYQIAIAEQKQSLGRVEEALSDFERILKSLRPSSWLYRDVRDRIETVYLRNHNQSELADYYAEQVRNIPDDIALRLYWSRSLRSCGRVEEALDALRAAVLLTPDDPNIQVVLIDTLQAANKIQEAADQLEELAKRDPGNPDHYVRLGEVHLQNTEIELERRQELAAQAWHELVQQRPEDPVMLSRAAELFQRIGRDDDVVKQYRRAIELAPDEPIYREYLAEFLFKRGRRDEALETWSSIVAGNRRNRDNLLRMVEVYRVFQLRDLCLRTISEATEFDLSIEERLRLAKVLSQYSKYEDAIDQLQRAEEMASSHDDQEKVWTARVEVYKSSGQLDQRIQLAKAELTEDSPAPAHRRLARLLDAASRTTEAIEAITVAVNKAPYDVKVLRLAADLFRQARMKSDAIVFYKKLVSLDPQFRVNYLKTISTLQMEQGSISEAMQTSNQLIAAQPSNPELYRLYAQQCFKAGDDQRGFDALRRSLEVAPRDSESRRQLAAALAERSRTSEAIEIYWEILRDSEKFSERVAMVEKLVSLFERTSEVGSLLARLEAFGRSTLNRQVTAMLIATAHQANSNPSEAISVLAAASQQAPGDAEILNSLVELCIATNDLEAAVSYQQKLASLLGTTPAHRELLRLKVRAGIINSSQAALQQIEVVSDPVSAVILIDNAIDQRDYEGAVRLCSHTLETRPGLWEVRARLAGLLMMLGNTGSASKEAESIRNLRLPPDTQPDSFGAASAGNPSLTGPSNPNQIHLQNLPPNANNFQRLQFGRRDQRNVTQLHSQLRMHDRYKRCQSAPALAKLMSDDHVLTSQSINSNVMPSMLKPHVFGHANYLAAAVLVAAAANENRLGETVTRLSRQVESSNYSPLQKLWAQYEIEQLASAFITKGDHQHRASAKQDLLWRLAEADPSVRQGFVSQILIQRRNEVSDAQEPLTETQIKVIEQSLADSKVNLLTQYETESVAKLFLAEIAKQGKKSAISRLNDALSKVDTPFAATLSLKLMTEFGWSSYVPERLLWIGQRMKKWAHSITAEECNNLQLTIANAVKLRRIEQDTILESIALLIAIESIHSHRASSHKSATNLQPQPGSMVLTLQKDQAGPGLAPGNSLSLALSTTIMYAAANKAKSDWCKSFVARLAKLPTIFTNQTPHQQAELRVRQLTNGNVQWWSGDQTTGYETIVKTSEKFKQDQKLWMLRALLAENLGQADTSAQGTGSV